MSRNKIIIIAAIIIAVAGTILFWQQKLKTNINNKQNQSSENTLTVPAINGVMVTEEVAKTRPIAVVIENHGDARPQSGLTDADIVYETLAEGGITRFLALYQTRLPKEIGPIRSARPYFNHVANQWGAVFAHVGGSTEALSELNSGVYKKLEDINQFFFGDYFYRSKERVAPHNAYTTIELLRQIIEKKKWSDWTPVKLGGFAVKATSELTPTVTEITAKFFDANYAVVFTYDPSTNSYQRTNGGKPAVDKNNNLQISPMNVLVQFVEDYSIPLENATGLGLRLEKGGNSVLFSNGSATKGQWSYEGGTTSYLQTNDDGSTSPMQFVPGQTWIILMPKSLTNNVTWK